MALKKDENCIAGYMHTVESILPKWPPSESTQGRLAQYSGEGFRASWEIVAHFAILLSYPTYILNI